MRVKKTGDPGPAEIGSRSRYTPHQACSVEGCSRKDRLKRGMCTGHYDRWRIYGDVQADVPFAAKGLDICTADECSRKSLSRGLCPMHYQRMAKTATTAPRPRATPQPCSISGCGSKVQARKLCLAHYRRFMKYGDPFGSAPATGRPKVCSVSACQQRPIARALCDRHYARWKTHGSPDVNKARRSKAARGICRAAFCDEPIHQESRCLSHYLRWLRYDRLCADATQFDPVPGGARGGSLAERFWARVNKTDTCWLWIGFVTESGYGLCPMGNRRYRPAHRVSWKLAGRDLVVGMHLDHLCRVRNCVNPDHLDQVTPAVNNARGVGPAAQNRRKTHCIRNHEFDLINTRWLPNGSRKCVACSRTANLGRRKKADRKRQSNIV